MSFCSYTNSPIRIKFLLILCLLFSYKFHLFSLFFLFSCIFLYPCCICGLQRRSTLNSMAVRLLLSRLRLSLSDVRIRLYNFWFCVQRLQLVVLLNSASSGILPIGCRLLENFILDGWYETESAGVGAEYFQEMTKKTSIRRSLYEHDGSSQV